VTVLVDEARWPWRGDLWAHLVSDTSLDELHDFAQAIGKRRLGFQGDHYDVDAADRDRAVAAGAVTVPGRMLVRRLRASGLRNAEPKPSWQVLGDSAVGEPVDPVLERLAAQGGRVQPLVDVVAGLDRSGGMRVAALVDQWRFAALIDVPADRDVPVLPAAERRALDLVVVGAARRDGERSIELFVER